MVLWYIDQVQEELETEEDILSRKALIEKIIDRLTYTVRILVIDQLKCILFFYIYFFILKIVTVLNLNLKLIKGRIFHFAGSNYHSVARR